MKRLIYALSVTLLLLSACSKGYSKGDNVHTNQECFSAISKEGYDEMTRYSVDRNGAAISLMVASGDVYVLPSYTHGKVSDIGVGMYQVDFDSYGKLWVASEFIED